MALPKFLFLPQKIWVARPVLWASKHCLVVNGNFFLCKDRLQSYVRTALSLGNCLICILFTHFHKWTDSSMYGVRVWYRIRIWIVVFCVGRREPGEKPSEQGREPTTNLTHVWEGNWLHCYTLFSGFHSSLIFLDLHCHSLDNQPLFGKERKAADRTRENGGNRAYIATWLVSNRLRHFSANQK